jgi:5-methylcytosine-specific restriction endonuclease McrA
MTRSRGKVTTSWLKQHIYVTDPHITSTANLALLQRQYFMRDVSIFSDWRMQHIRRKWMRNQLKNPDSMGGLTCAICGKRGLRPSSTDYNTRATLDHIVDISRGGKWNDPSNFQVACAGCNTKKSMDSI